MLVNCLSVGIGGFVGSVLRYLCGFLAPEGALFPVVTFGINIVGSFALGFLATLFANGALRNEQLSLMLRVGLCGGFTTFSTFSLETANLLRDGAYGLACAYGLGSAVVCVAAAIAGYAAANVLRPAA